MLLPGFLHQMQPCGEPGMEFEACDMAGRDAVVRPISHAISAWRGAVPVRSGKSRTLVAERISSAVAARSQGNASELVTHGGT